MYIVSSGLEFTTLLPQPPGAGVAGNVSILSADGLVTQESGTEVAIVWIQGVLQGQSIEGFILSLGEVWA